MIMARYDKYDSLVSGTRAKLESAWDGVNSNPKLNTVYGVSLNGNGRIIVGAGGQTGLVGIVIVTSKQPAGSVVDIMSIGEVVEATDANDSGNPFAAGTLAYVDTTTGELTSTSSGSLLVGYSVEEGRVRVNLGFGDGGASQ